MAEPLRKTERSDFTRIRQPIRPEGPRLQSKGCTQRVKSQSVGPADESHASLLYNHDAERGSLECLSHISRLTRMVKTLHTLPMTENDVAEMTARSAKEK